MAIKCQLCGFEAKTAQGLAGHKRLAHNQAAPGLQGNGFPFLPNEDTHNHEMENHWVGPDTLGGIIQIGGKIAQLEIRIDNLMEIATAFKAGAEEKMNELLAKAK